VKVSSNIVDYGVLALSQVVLSRCQVCKNRQPDAVKVITPGFGNLLFVKIYTFHVFTLLIINVSVADNVPVHLRLCCQIDASLSQ